MLLIIIPPLLKETNALQKTMPLYQSKVPFLQPFCRILPQSLTFLQPNDAHHLPIHEPHECIRK